jgi:hypothetical protein
MLFTCNIGYLILPQFILSESLTIFFLILFVERFFYFIQTQKLFPLALAGLALGAATLINPATLYFIIPLIIFIACTTKHKKLLALLLFTASFFIPITSYQAYQYSHKEVLTQEQNLKVIYPSSPIRKMLKTHLDLYTTNLKVLIEPTQAITSFSTHGPIFTRIKDYITTGTTHTWLKIIGLIEFIWNLLKYLLALLALLWLLRQKQWGILFFFTSYIFYFSLVTGFDGCARYRTMFDFLLLILAAIGIWTLLDKQRRNLYPPLQEKTFQRCLIALLSFLVLGIFHSSLFRQLTWDEFEGIHSGWNVLYDGVMYRDFFQHHHPFSFYLIALIFKIFGVHNNTIYIIRFIYFLMFLGIGYFTYRLATLLTNKTIGLSSIICLYSLPVFTVYGTEMRPDVPMMLFAMAALTIWFYYRSYKKTSLLITSALLFSLSFLFLQKAIFLLIFFGILMLIDWVTHKISFTQILLYGAVFSIPILFYFLYLIATHSLTEYVVLNWLLNAKVVGTPFLPATYLHYPIGSALLVWIFFLVGSIYTLKQTLLRPILFLAWAGSCIIFLIPAHLTYYIIPGLPFVAIIAAYTIANLTRYKSLILAILMLMSVRPTIRDHIHWPMVEPNTQQIKEIDNQFKKDTHFFWFSTIIINPNIEYYLQKIGRTSDLK